MRTYTEADVRQRMERLRARKVELIRHGRRLNDATLRRGRDFNATERAQFATIMEEVEEINEELRLGDELLTSRPTGRNERWRRQTFRRR